MLPSFKPRPPIHVPSHLHRGRPRPRQHLICCVTTTSPPHRPVTDLHYGWFGSKEGLGVARIALRSGQWKMPHAQLVPRSRMAQRFTGSGFKIATDIAGHARIIRKAPTRPGRSFSWRKCLTVVMFRSSLVPRSIRLDPLRQAFAERL